MDSNLVVFIFAKCGIKFLFSRSSIALIQNPSDMILYDHWALLNRITSLNLFGGFTSVVLVLFDISICHLKSSYYTLLFLCSDLQRCPSCMDNESADVTCKIKYFIHKYTENNHNSMIYTNFNPVFLIIFT